MVSLLTHYSKQNNEIKSKFSSFFKKRSVFPLVRAAHEEKDLQRFAEGVYNNVREEFKKQVEQLKAEILQGIFILHCGSLFGYTTS